MKKFVASLVLLAVFAFGLPLTAEAQTCRRGRKASRSYASQRYYAPSRYSRGYASQRRPSFYRRHRNLINLGIATGAGALIGGIAGGKRGAGAGALIGAGSGALYTYVLRPKRRRY